MDFNRSTFLVLLLFLITSTLLFSCKDDPELPNSELPRVEEREVIDDTGPVLPTVYSGYGQSYVDSIPQYFDTTFVALGKRYSLHIELKLNGEDTVFCDEPPYEKNGKLYVTRYSGRDIIYQFHLKNAKNQTLWKKELTKKDYFKDLGTIVAQSNMWMPTFETFLPATQQLVLTQDFWVPDSDFGVQGILFFDLTGNYQIKYHMGHGGSNGECGVVYSSDSSFLLTCSELISENGKVTNIHRKYSDVAGNMVIGDYAFVSYAFVKDTSALGGRLYNAQGKIVKEFEFDGYGGALGYMLPRIYLPKFGRYYFVDEQNESVLMIPEADPLSFKKYPFETVSFPPDQMVLDTSVVLEKEVNDHKLGIDEKGDVVTYQIGDWTGKWRFFNEKE